MKFPPLLIVLQFLMPQHLVTRVVHAFMNIRWPFLKNKIIATYIRHYGVNMEEALYPEPHQYTHFNDFFTRPLKPGARTIPEHPHTWISPVDGVISQLGAIQEGTLIQAKGHDYSVEALLGGELALARQFQRGQFMTIYLSPKDYHRIHMPIDGTLQHMVYVPGSLFSVNLLTADHVPSLFTRNERVCCVFSHGEEQFAMILVGALIVGGMSTTWHGRINPQGSRKTPLYVNYRHQPITLLAGEEMGRFWMGSTVILLRSTSRPWRSDLTLNHPIQWGNPLE